MLFPWGFPMLPCDYDLPSTIYALLNSYVNYGKEEKTKIKNLAKEGRTCIFDFDYPLTDKMTKEYFETIILNHYMQRRIGFETVTGFKIALSSKMNEIMPIYNKLFDALDGWNLFSDGEIVTRVTTDKGSNTMTNSVSNSGSNVSDRRFSKMPQNQITDVQNGSHMTEYNYDKDTTSNTSQSNGSGTNSNETNETITRTPADKLSIYKQFVENRTSIFSMIFHDLDDLFYGLV